LLLLGVSRHPRRLGAVVVIELAIGDLFEPSPSDYEWFLILLHGSSRIGYSSGARGLEDPHLVSGCAAPAEGSTLDSWLARDPSSGCIATTRSSLPGSKWTSVKKSCIILLPMISFVYVITLIDWYIGHIFSHQRWYIYSSSLLYLLFFILFSLSKIAYHIGVSSLVT
jgi:hypothetical protein